MHLSKFDILNDLTTMISFLKTTVLFLCLILFFSQQGFAEVKLPRLISNGMVLQRNSELKIWGWASVGEAIVISFNQMERQTQADAQGQWQVTFPPMREGGPYTMRIDASNQLTITDIWLGDVWLCSGQSNMELPMSRVKPMFEDEVATSTNPKIRQFDVATRYHFATEQKDLETGEWVSADPESVLKFTAVGYFFARALYEQYQVPIGLIKAAVGGSPAEAWLSEKALKTYPHYEAINRKYRDTALVNSIKEADAAKVDSWNARVDSGDRGLHEATKWYEEAYRPQDWKEALLPGYWDEQQLFETTGRSNINGAIWFRKEIDVPATMTGKQALLLLGRIVDRDMVYVNGRLVGSTAYQYPPRRYILPPDLLSERKNVITVRVISNIGQGGFVEGKAYALHVENEYIDLSGVWQSKLGYAASPMPEDGVTFHYQPGGLFNGMIAPLLNYGIKGVIWYQGEANTGRAEEYQTLFPDMISDWRSNWQQDFPFLYVQLANFRAPKKEPTESAWAELRNAQLKTLAVPNTRMVVATDVGEANDIHPLDKETVGKRLALAARNLAYSEKKLVSSGPLYRSFKVKDNRVMFTFAHCGAGLKALAGELQGFSIAGPDGNWVWAKAEIVGKRVVVWSDAVDEPTMVRYAWADNPSNANLYNEEGLPASPFMVKLSD